MTDLPEVPKDDRKVTTLEGFGDSSLLVRLGELIFIWVTPGDGDIQVREAAKFGEHGMAAESLMAHLHPIYEDGSRYPYTPQGFVACCESFVKMAAGAPIADAIGEEDEAAEAEERRGAAETRTKFLLTTFARHLLAALDGDAPMEDAIKVFKQVQEQAHDILAGYLGQEEMRLPLLREARALLVREQGWVKIRDDTLRYVDGGNDRSMTMVFIPEQTGNLPLSEDVEMSIPMGDVIAMMTPLPTDPPIPDARTFAAGEGHDKGQP